MCPACPVVYAYSGPTNCSGERPDGVVSHRISRVTRQFSRLSNTVTGRFAPLTFRPQDVSPPTADCGRFAAVCFFMCFFIWDTLPELIKLMYFLYFQFQVTYLYTITCNTAKFC